MSKHQNTTIDLTQIETRARKLRAEFIAGFFKRRAH